MKIQTYSMVISFILGVYINYILGKFKTKPFETIELFGYIYLTDSKKIINLLEELKNNFKNDQNYQFISNVKMNIFSSNILVIIFDI